MLCAARESKDDFIAANTLIQTSRAEREVTKWKQNPLIWSVKLIGMQPWM